MANRTFIDKSYTMLKREVRLYAAVAFTDEAGGITPTLQTWNYPVFGGGTNARTYTAAPTTPAGQGYPLQYQTGAEGVRSITKTGTGLYTLKMQDNYQRVLGVQVNGQLAGGLSLIVGAGINTTLTDMDATDGSEVALALLSATGTAADPGVETLLFSITLADATEP